MAGAFDDCQRVAKNGPASGLLKFTCPLTRRKKLCVLDVMLGQLPSSPSQAGIAHPFGTH